MRLVVEPAGLIFDAQVGDRLIDLADSEPDLGVPFSCRSANCGTCRVDISLGANAFASADEDERETLDAFEAGTSTRLCCQLRIVCDVAEVRIRATDD